MTIDRLDLIAVLGPLLLVGGLAMVSPPFAVVVLGAILLGSAVVMALTRQARS